MFSADSFSEFKIAPYVILFLEEFVISQLDLDPILVRKASYTSVKWNLLNTYREKNVSGK